MRAVNAVDDAAWIGRFRQAVMEACLRDDSNVLDGPAAATQIPDLDAAIAARRGQHATSAATGLETDLFEGSSVVT